MQLFDIIKTMLIILNIGMYCFGNELKRVKERIRYLEDRINSESKFRGEDYAAIIERMDDLDVSIDASLLQRSEYVNVVQETPEADSETIESLKEDLWRIRTAFSKEKFESIRIRRDILKIEEGLSAVNQHVENFCKVNINSTKQMNKRYEISEDLIVQMSEKVDKLLAIFNETKAFKFEELKSQIEENVKEKIVDTILSEIRNISKATILTTVDSMKVDINGEMEEKSNRIDSNDSVEYESCLKAKESGENKNGVYKLRNSIKVYCDQVTDGGGWTVFQRRLTGEVDFYRSWNAYKHGFGNLNFEFWLGNENLNLLTFDGNHELRVEIEDFDGRTAYAKYSRFRIHSEEDMYKLEINGYSGNASDSLNYHNGLAFSTFDNDNDKYRVGNCAIDWHGAWWYGGCYESNLNGQYFDEPNKIDPTGISWYFWKKANYCLKKTEMKFR